MPERLAIYTLYTVIIVCVFSGIFGYYGFPWLWSRYNRMELQRRCVRQKRVLLTLDDGPGDRLTPRILDILAEHGAKASFFLLGRNIIGNEKIVQRIATEGHEICSHGFDHLHAWKVLPWNSICDMHKGWQAIDQALGTHKEAYSYRPPYGKLNLVTLLYLLWKRIPIIYWTVDSRDTWSWINSSPSYESLSEKIAQGGVLLVHDFDRATHERDGYILGVLESTIATAQNNHLKISTISQFERSKG